MFVKNLVFVVFSLISIKADNDEPNVSMEEAQAELELAKSGIQKSIIAANSRLNYYHDMFESSSNNSQMEGIVMIQYEQRAFLEQVAALEELGQSVGVDISTCLLYSEEVQNLANSLIEGLEECIGNKIIEGANVLDEYKYLLDIAINKVYALEFQLGLCDADSEDCISPIYEQILWEKYYRHEMMEVSLIEAYDLFNEFGVTVGNCKDVRVSQIVSYVNATVDEISECADIMIGYKFKNI